VGVTGATWVALAAAVAGEVVKTTASQMAEQIIDEGSGHDRNVIIQMDRPKQESQHFISRAAGAIGERRMTMSARDLLPTDPETLRDTSRTNYQRRKLSRQRASASSQLASSTAAATTTKQRQKGSRDTMSQLLSHDNVQSALADAGTTSKTPGFWASNSLAVTLSKDDLAKVVDEVDGISGVYVNRKLAVPRVVEVGSLPRGVADNKGGAWGLHAIGAMATWGAFGARGAGVTIGILDTGIDQTHPDLAGKVAAWAEFDVNGQEVLGSVAHDTDEHGTHVAGTVVGGNASGNWIGVAPDANVAAAMVIDGQVGGTDAQVLAGIDWAISQNVDVISMSLGGFTLGPVIGEVYTEAMITALLAGIPVVIAIGNDGEQTSGSPGNDLFSLGVGATDWRDEPAGFSGGRTHALLESSLIQPSFLPIIFSKPDLSAPGVAIDSSVPGNGYKAFSGTSMATPHVSGAIALLLSATNKFASVPDNERAFLVQDLLVGSVEELGENGQDHRYGFGRLDALRAVGFAKESGF